MSRRNLQGDENARVPFAMVAVLILMMSMFSMAYVGGIQRQQAGLRLVGAEVSRQSSVLHQVEEKMALEGFYIASKSVLVSTQFLCNETMLDRCFQENYSRYLEETFPLFIDPYRVDIRDFVSSVFLEERNILDLVPSNATGEQNITLKDDSGTVSNATVKTLDTTGAEVIGETSALARYVVVGNGNCTVTNVNSGSATERPISFEKGIDTPFPLMNSKMLAVESAAGNNAMGIARVVKYILTTLAQFRVLEGYGSGLHLSPGDTADVITLPDVQMAVNVAVLLETARLFRSYDAGILASLDGMGMGGQGQALTSLMDEYLNNGTLDPADIIALHIGMGDRPIPVDMILAQAFNAIADQFILKYLDYFGIMDIANDIYRTAQKIGQLIEDTGKSISQFIFGSDGENRDGAEQVAGWIDNLEANWPPTTSSIPGIVVSSSPASRTDLAVLDVLQPVNDVYHYWGNCSQLLGQISQPIIDPDGVTIGDVYLASISSTNVSAVTRPSTSTAYPAGYLADFRPASMLRQAAELSSLWEDFYDLHYAAQEDVIYDSIRDAVKNVTAEMARLITAFIGQKSLSLSGYSGGEFAIDPNDALSVLEGIRLMIDSVILETTNYLQANPGAVNSLLTVLTNNQAQIAMDFMEFVSLNYDIIADKSSCLEAAATSLSRNVLLNSSIAVQSTVQYSTSYSVYNSVGLARGNSNDPIPFNCTSTPDKDIHSRILGEQNRAELALDMAPHAETAYSRLKAAESQWNYYGSPQNGMYIKAIEGTVQGMSGSIIARFIGSDSSALVGMAGGMVKKVLDGIIWSGGVSNTQYSPEMAYSDESGRMAFEIYEGRRPDADTSGNSWRETFTVSQPDGMLVATPSVPGQDAPSLPAGRISVCVSDPVGVHYTDATTFNERPFETRWNVSVKGILRLSVSSASMPYLDEGAHMPAAIEREMELDLNIPVLAYSGWDLVGLNYSSTATLAGDVDKLFDIVDAFFGWVWDTIAGPIDWIIDQIMMVVDFFADIIGTLLGYASDVMNIITSIIGFLVETVQDFLRDVAGWVFDSIVGWIIDLLPDGTEFAFSMFGFDFLVSFGSEEEIEAADSGRGGRMLSLETRGSLFGAGLELGLELVALSDEVAEAVDMDYDLLLWSQVELFDFVLDTRIDPFMAVQEHIVECNGRGNGFGLELFIPVVETRHSVQYSLHDIPGVGAALSNIPIPFLGLKASVNAGLEIVYTLRGIEADHVVINEVELNPRGETAGNQWLELYNPTDSEASLNNWTLGSSTHPEFNRTFNSTMIIDPGGYFMVHYFNETLPQESVMLELLDPGGKKVDFTPLISESDSSAADGNSIGPMGSQMTWQRSPNGANLSMAGKWVLGNGSIGSENAAINISFKTLVWNLLKGAFNATWQNLKDQMALSLDFIVKLVTQFIQRFIDDILKVIARSVIETSLFLDVMLTDMTGTGGGGITLSFVIEGGDTLAAILRWIIGSVSAFLAKFGKPTQPAQYPRLGADVPEHLFVRLEFYGMVQVPQMVKSAAQAGEEPDPVKLTGRIEANIPALAALVGKEMGRWRINFGVYIEKMPAAIADPLFGTGDATPDVWVFKGTVYEA